MESLTESAKNHRTVFLIGGALLVILAISLHRFSTWKWGIGVSHDSIFYISASENFLMGNGISQIGGGNEVKPLTHFPPLYPLSLSLLGTFIGAREAADWCAGLFYGVNVLLITIIIYQGSNSLKAGFVGGILALISPLLLDIHFEAMSEPLYLASTLVSLIILTGYFKDQQNWQWILAVVAASLAYLTRYIGISVLLTGVFSMFLFVRGTYRMKLKNAVLFGAIAFIPNLIWYVRNYLLTGSLTNRVLAFHPVTKEKLNEGLLSLSEWIFPEHTPVGLGLGLLVFIFFLVVIGFILKSKKMKELGSKSDMNQVNFIPSLLVVHITVYSILLFASLTFFDISTRLSNRILIPLYAMSLILGVISFQRIIEYFEGTEQRFLFLASALLFALVFVVYANRSWELIREMRQEGSGFNSVSWRSSEIVAIVKKMGPGAIVYSNEALPLYYLTRIGAYGIPEKFDPVKSEERDDFQRSMEVMRERLENSNSALVVFHQGYLREGMPSLEEISEGFVIAHESRDGVIFVDPEILDQWDDLMSQFQ